jgi:squalene-hopene/tetraprenyl-beta-curcumene cyclase
MIESLAGRMQNPIFALWATLDGKMLSRIFVLVLTAAAASGGDWNQRLAADYLDARQKAWLAWPTANGNGVPCISCHTGMPYLVVRPVLRRALGEAERTSYETALLNSLSSRLDKRTPEEMFPKRKGESAAQAAGVESIFAALLLTFDSPPGTLSSGAEKAFDRMWSLQRRDGEAAGSFPWFSLELDPWEMPESAYYGASLAALAVGIAPKDYQSKPVVRESTALLHQYLRERKAGQPLHNRMMLLWAASPHSKLLNDTERRALVDEILHCQQKDGGWTMESLGAFTNHPNAPASPGSNAYATAFAAFIVQQAGVNRSEPRLARALEWLGTHQDRESGYWDAMSMNKQFEAGSMMKDFMRDAATSFAALALLQNKH